MIFCEAIGTIAKLCLLKSGAIIYLAPLAYEIVLYKL